MAEKRFELWIRHGDYPNPKLFLGVFSEAYCRAYCKQFAMKCDLHVFCYEVCL